MKKISLVVFALIWISSLVMLVVSLTDIIPNNPFKEYRIIVGMGFIVMTRFLGLAYRRLMKVRSISG